MIKIKEIEIGMPSWKWWHYLLSMVVIILVIRRDYQTLGEWLKLWVK